MANSSGWGDGAANNTVGWGRGANNAVGWGSSHATSWAGATDIVGLTTDADAQAFITAAAITDSTQQAAINNLVIGLKADSLWSKMKAVYPFVTDNRNLLGYTEDFGNGYWTKGYLTSSSLGTPPIGLSTSFKIADSTNTTTSHFFIPNFSAATSVQYTASAYFKAAEYEFVQIYPTSNNGCVFNLTAGTYNILGAGTATISNVGNGWYRCTFTFTATGATVHISPNKTSTSQYTYASTIGNGIYMSSPQVELGSTATTYQPIATTQQAYIASQFKYNLKDPRDLDAAFRLVFNGGWTHSSTGATPNGTNGYADTKLIPNTNLTLNSCSFSVYSRNNFTPSAAQSFGVSSDAAYMSLIGSTFLSTKGVNSYMYSLSQPDILISPIAQNLAALFVNTRTSASSAKQFRNATQLTLVTSQGQTTQPTTSFTFGAFRNSTSFQDYNTYQHAFAHIADGLNDTEVANLYTRVQAFQTSLSRQV